MSAASDKQSLWIVEHGCFLRRVAGDLLGDMHGAEDAAQEAWLAALQARPPRELAAWLVTVTRRLAGRYQRAAGRRREREQAAARAEHVPAVDSIAARAEIVRLVGEALEDLPEPFRATLVYRYWEGLPPRRIAARMGVPVATVHSRTRRGLARMRAELERRAPREGRWEENLAFAAGLLQPAKPASTPIPKGTVLGIAAMKSKTWGLSALAVVALIAGTAVTSTLLRLEPDQPAVAAGRPLATPLASPLDDRALPDNARVAAARREVARVPAAATAPARTQVRVVDPDGLPVAGAEILTGAVADALAVLGTTDAEGRAALEPGPARQVLCARAEGWAPSPVYVWPATPSDDASSREPRDDLVLQLPQVGAPLWVDVRGPDGLPFAGARVFAGREQEDDYRLPDGTVARTTPGFEAFTDRLGTARFHGLAPGWVRVAVSHESLACAIAFATVEVGRLERLEVELARGIHVSGRVVDEDGTPVAGAFVQRSSCGRATTTADDGSYRLEHVRPGKLVAVGPLGRRVEERLEGEPGDELRWNPVLPFQPAVLGRVVAQNGAPLVGWTVHASSDTWPGWRRGATTDAQGLFAIYDPPEGELRVEVREKAGAALPDLVRPAVEAGPEELVLLVPEARSGRVTGLVAPCGGTVPLYLRLATRPDRAGLTAGPGLAVDVAADGHFDFADVPVGRYELVLEGPPYGWFRLARLEVTHGETTDAGEIELPATGLLRARTYWGDPSARGEASFLLERRGDFVTVGCFRGTFPEEMTLAPGTYTLQTEVTPGPQREVDFTIHAAATTEIELDLAATCNHRVRVGYASRRSPAGAVTLVVRRVDDELVAFSNSVARVEDGRWFAEVELGSGRFEFLARDAAGLETRVVHNLYTSRPDREIYVSLPDGSDE